MLEWDRWIIMTFWMAKLMIAFKYYMYVIYHQPVWYCWIVKVFITWLLELHTPGFKTEKLNFLISYLWFNISRCTSCRKTWFWVIGVQSQNISKHCSNIDFEISHILESFISCFKRTISQHIVFDKIFVHGGKIQILIKY